jgi:hypothetical protein
MSDDSERSKTITMFYWSMVTLLFVGLSNRFEIGQAGSFSDWQMTLYLFGTVIVFLLMGIGMDIHKVSNSLDSQSSGDEKA